MSPALGPRPCSVDALCHLSDTQSVHYPNRHMQAFQKPPEGHSISSSDFIARFLASAVWGLGQGRCVLIPGLLLYPRSPSSSYSPWLCTSISLCHWQFYPEPQCSWPSVLREPTMVSLDRWNAGGQLEKPGTSLLEGLSTETWVPRDESADRATRECAEGKSVPILEGPSGSKSVPTHGSMLILVSSFTTQMPKESSRGSGKHVKKSLKKAGYN